MLASGRVSVRELRDDDSAVIETWYREAAMLAQEERSLDNLLKVANGSDRDLFVIVQVDRDEAIGLIEYLAAGGWLEVSLIALAKSYRGWGYGTEAVRLLEEWAQRQGIAKRFRADVPVANGLALYFWLRLGYQPAAREEVRWHGGGERDRMAMVRVGD